MPDGRSGVPAVAGAGRGDRHPAMDRSFLLHRIVPALRALVRAGYFSFEVEGIEHVPRDGPVVHALNHAGWFALDAFFVGLAVTEAHGIERAPFFAAADAALAAPWLGPVLRRAGAVPASWFRRPERLPPEIQVCGMFPEGVRGNTKPFWEAYRMRTWNRGFVRVAIALQAPIVPGAVLGGEECLPVAKTVRLLAPLVGSEVGLPLTLLPLPARWKVIFHGPVRVPASGRSALADGAMAAQLASQIQATVQRTLDLHAAGYPLARLSSLVASVRERWRRGARDPSGAG